MLNGDSCAMNHIRNLVIPQWKLNHWISLNPYSLYSDSETILTRLSEGLMGTSVQSCTPYQNHHHLLMVEKKGRAGSDRKSLLTAVK